MEFKLGQPISKQLSDLLKKKLSIKELEDMSIYLNVNYNTLYNIRHRKVNITPINKHLCVEMLRVAVQESKKESKSLLRHWKELVNPS